MAGQERDVAHESTSDEQSAIRNFRNWARQQLGFRPVKDKQKSPLQENLIREEESAGGGTYREKRLWSVDRYVKAPALSPDGRLLACIVVEQDQFPLALQIPLDAKGEPIPGQEREVKLPIDGAVRHVLYSPDGKWLACEVAPDGGDHEQIWFVTTDPEDPNAYNVDLTNFETVELVSWEDDLVAVSAFDKEGTVEGKLLNPLTGESFVVDRRTGGALVHSRDMHSLFRVGSRGNRELLAVEPDGSWSPLMPVDNGSTTDQGFVVPDGDSYSVIVRSDHSAERFRLLRLTPRPHGFDVKVLMEHEEAEVEEFTVSSDGTTAAVLWNTDGWCDLEIVRLTEDGAEVIVVPELPSLIASTPSLTADGSRLAVAVSGPEFPPSVVVFDINSRSWVGDHFRVAASALGELVVGVEAGLLSEQPKDQRGREVLSVWGTAEIIPELHTYEARDGLQLSGWLYQAVGRNPSEPAPMVVYFHGGPEGQSRPEYNNVMRKLAAAGYSVFQPNVRGSLGKGRKFSQADDRYGRFAALDDVEDSLDYLIDAGLATDGNALIMGRSYGGYLVHASLTRHAGRWLGGIAACGMSDLETFYRDTDPWVAAAALPKYGDPQLDKQLLEEASPLRNLKKVKVPVLFIHGQQDFNVPVSEAYQAMGVLTAHGVDTELLLFDDEGHNFERLPNRYEMAQRILKFCERVFYE